MLYDRTQDRLRRISTLTSQGISKDPRDRREYPRCKGACDLYYKEERFELIDWSAGGCAVEGLSGPEEGSKIRVTLKVTGPRTSLTQEVEARVIRVEDETIALKFLDLSIEERDLLLISQGAFSDNVFVMETEEEDIL